MESIITKAKDHCYNCGSSYGIQMHHCMHGTSNRANADKYGLIVPLCSKCHQALHDNDTMLDRWLHEVAQVYFEKLHSREEWMEVFGKNYLEDTFRQEAMENRAKVAAMSHACSYCGGMIVGGRGAHFKEKWACYKCEEHLASQYCHEIFRAMIPDIDFSALEDVEYVEQYIEGTYKTREELEKEKRK